MNKLKHLIFVFFLLLASNVMQAQTRYEAENATRTGGGIASDHAGYSGTGFWAWVNSVGNKIVFTVNATAGSNTVTCRYANGNGSSRTMSLYVNGTKIRQVTFATTAGWSTWANKDEAVTLVQGTNTIEYRYDSGDSGSINIDYITCVSNAPAQTRYEAENATRTGGGIASDHAGYSGTGFWAYVGSVGNKIAFSVNASSGSNTVTCRYANGMGNNRTMSLYVNGTRIRQVIFPATASWSTWANKDEAVTLVQGTNTIEYRYDSGDNGNINIDYIAVAGGSAPPPTSGTETRPSYNTGTGFFMKNAKIYDANGKEFIPIGYNGTVFWQDETCQKNSLDDVARTGANAIRLVQVTPATANSWSWGSRTENHRALVASSVANKLVPMLEFHDVTCGSMYENDPDGKSLKQVVDYWVSPAMVQLCKDYERQLMVNIANEWGNAENLLEWKNAYKTAIGRIRAAGIKNMLVIDAGGNCGQNPNSIITYAQEIINSDPERNVVFSIHMYAFWYTGTTNAAGWRFQVEAKLQEFKNNNIPIIVGEFGWEGTPDISYDPRVLMAKTAELGYGWLYWAWYDQPQHANYYQIVKDQCTGYNSDADLTTPGINIVNGVNGVRARSKTATIYNAVARIAKESPEKVTLYPNPSDGGEVQLQLNGFTRNAKATLAVADMSGRVIFQSEVVTDETGGKQVSLNTSSFKNGVHIISIKSGSVQQVQRLVIVR